MLNTNDMQTIQTTVKNIEVKVKNIHNVRVVIFGCGLAEPVYS